MSKRKGGYLLCSAFVASAAVGCSEETGGRDLVAWDPPDSPVAGETGAPADDDPLVAFEPPTDIAPPAPPLLLAKVANPTSVAADPNGVYWTDAAQTSSELSAVFQQAWGDSPMERIAAPKGYPVSLALHGEYVYWVDEQNGDVQRMRRAGDAPLESIIRGQEAPHALAVSDRFIVWTNIGNGMVMAFDRYHKQVYARAKHQGQPAAIGLTSSKVVWTDLSDGAIRTSALFHDEIVTLVEGVELGDGLAVDETHAYYGDHAKRAVMRVPLTGGEPEIVVANQADAGSIAVAGDTLVWTSERFGEIRQARLGSNRVHTLAALQDEPTSLVLTNGRAHWVSRGDGGIWLAGLAE